MDGQQARLVAARLVVAGLLILAALAAALPAAAQQSRVHRIGVILQGGPYFAAVEGLREGLRELGLEEGKHFILHVRDVKGDLAAVEKAARLLEQERVDLIYALSTSTTLAVKRATKTVPIVFYAGTDPVAVGLVETFRKPGGRLTGVYGRLTDLTAKRLELLKEMAPRIRRVVAFYNPDNPAAQRSARIARDAAGQLRIDLVERPVTSVEALRAGLAALRPTDGDALFYLSDAMVTSQEDVMIDTANARRLPSIHTDKESIARGALATYGESRRALGRLAAKYVQRILRGAQPGQLPIEQLTRPQFVINLRTAKAIGLVIPPAVIARADEVVE